MNVFLLALLTTSVTMSAVILCVLFLNKALVNKAPAAFRYYIWLIVLMGLLILYKPAIPVPFAFVAPPSFIVNDTSEPASGYLSNTTQANETQAFEAQQAFPVISDTTPCLLRKMQVSPSR